MNCRAFVVAFVQSAAAVGSTGRTTYPCIPIARKVSAVKLSRAHASVLLLGRWALQFASCAEGL